MDSTYRKRILMKSEEKIKRNSHFRYIYNRGKSLSNDTLVLYRIKNNKPVSRLGISVSKKVGNSVVRNKVKRLIRECYRVNRGSYKTGFDFIFIARQKASTADYAKVESAMKHLMRKSGMFIEE
ncbi:MAG: ribonuclease P protein component [Clostridium sp.]